MGKMEIIIHISSLLTTIKINKIVYSFASMITLISIIFWLASYLFFSLSLLGGIHLYKKKHHNNNNNKNIHFTAFGQATITIPASNLSIPLAGNSLGNLTAQNTTAGQIIQNQQQQQQQQSQQNQSTSQANNANAQNQQTHQSVILQRSQTNSFLY